jgi:hypothetical protein
MNLLAFGDETVRSCDIQKEKERGFHDGGIKM